LRDLLFGFARAEAGVFKGFDEILYFYTFLGGYDGSAGRTFPFGNDGF